MKNTDIVSGIIYGLHNGDGMIRYIGYTTLTPARRLTLHRCTATTKDKNTVKAKWMRKHGLENIQMEVLESYTEIAFGDLKEREVIRIAEGLAAGMDLTNGTTGGDGGPGYRHTEAQKALWSIERKGVPSAFAGRTHTEESRQKMSDKLAGENSPWFGREFTDEHKQNIKRGKHVQHHESKGITKDGCAFCASAQQEAA